MKDEGVGGKEFEKRKKVSRNGKFKKASDGKRARYLCLSNISNRVGTLCETIHHFDELLVRIRTILLHQNVCRFPTTGVTSQKHLDLSGIRTIITMSWIFTEYRDTQLGQEHYLIPSKLSRVISKYYIKSYGKLHTSTLSFRLLERLIIQHLYLLKASN